MRRWVVRRRGQRRCVFEIERHVERAHQSGQLIVARDGELEGREEFRVLDVARFQVETEDHGRRTEDLVGRHNFDGSLAQHFGLHRSHLQAVDTVPEAHHVGVTFCGRETENGGSVGLVNR